MAGDYAVVRLGDSLDGPRPFRMKFNTPKGEVEDYLSILDKEIVRSAVDFNKLQKTCFELICRMPLPMWIFDKGFVLRSRRNFNGEVFRNASEISYNPFPDKIGIGRFNLDREAVFYSSVPLSTSGTQGYASSICEGAKEIFDTEGGQSRYEFTVGKWVVAKPINVILLTFYEPAIKNCRDAKLLDGRFGGDLREALSADDYRTWRGFQEFFSQRAAKKYDSQTSYLLTTAFYHALQQRYGDKLGILYSSSMTENQGMNLALTKGVIDGGFLSLEGANMVRCERNPSNYKKYTVYPCSNYAVANDQGKIAFTSIV